MSSAARLAAALSEDLSPEDLRRVMTMTREELARLLGQLETAAATGDATAFQRAAHGIAGSAATVGAEDLERAARRAMTRADNAASLQAMAADVRMQNEIVMEQIDRLSNDMSSS